MLENAKKITKGHNVVKNKKTKNSKSYAYFQIMTKHSAKFQISSIKDVAESAGTRYESARAITLSKMAETKFQKPHAHLHMIRRQSIEFQISPMKDVRAVAGTRWDGRKDGRNDGRTDRRTRGRTRVISIAPPPPTTCDKEN